MSETANGGFEEGLRRLEEIVKKLEAGDLALETSLRLFEEGTRLTRELNATLSRAEHTVEVLMRDAEGALKPQPFVSEGGPEA